MGLIAGVIPTSEEPTESDPDAHADGETPYLSQAISDSLDPLLTEFNTEHVRLTKDDASLVLGLLILISNPFGD